MEKTKEILFLLLQLLPALHFHVFFLQNYLLQTKLSVVARGDIVPLGKGTENSINASFPNLFILLWRNLPDCIILDNWALLSFIYVDILLAKASAILVFCIGVNNNKWGKSHHLEISSLLFLILFHSYYLLQTPVCLIVNLLV